MIDRDLGELFGIATKVLKQAVKRNIKRFPLDFMFELTNEEFQNWRSQIVTSKSDIMGLRYPTSPFTIHPSLFIPHNHTTPIHVRHEYQAFRDISNKIINRPFYPFPFIIIIMNKDDPTR